MKIIVGLGNPGKEYELTHHNMGFLTVDEIANRFNVQVNKLKFKALLGEFNLNGEKVILVKPQTYMNSSGEAVRPIMDFYKVAPEDLILIYDDIDLPLGNIRVKGQGSAGTHNGMRSVIYQLQYDNFPRIRIGIGGPGDIPLINFVTMKITDSEAPVLKESVLHAADAAEVIIRSGVQEAMMRFNVKVQK